MNDLAGPPNRPKDFRNIDGVLIHKRWLNPDGTLKTGAELEKEQLMVDLQLLTDKLLAWSQKTFATPLQTPQIDEKQDKHPNSSDIQDNVEAGKPYRATHHCICSSPIN